MSNTSLKKTRVLTGCALLTAVSVVLQFLEFPISFLIPSFIKFDFSDLPVLIGSFAYGPVAGVSIALLKNIIHMPFSSSAFIGEFSNFLLSASFALVAGLVYKKKKTKKNAFVAGLLASFAMAAVSLPLNYFLIYPLYYKVLNFPEVAVLGMYQVILPSVKSMISALLIFNVPFTFIKGLACVGISMLIYKPLSHVLKGTGKKSEKSDETPVDNEGVSVV